MRLQGIAREGVRMKQVLVLLVLAAFLATVAFPASAENTSPPVFDSTGPGSTLSGWNLLGENAFAQYLSTATGTGGDPTRVSSAAAGISGTGSSAILTPEQALSRYASQTGTGMQDDAISGADRITALAETDLPMTVQSPDFGGSNNSGYATDRVIVRFKPGVSGGSVVSRAHQEVGGQVREDFADLGLTGVQVVSLPTTLSVEDAIARYRNNSNVLYVEPDFRISVCAVPNDPSFTSQWGEVNTGQSGGRADADVSADAAWDITRGSGDVIVAVIDSGVDYTHPDLSANIWQTNSGLTGHNFVAENNDPMDDNGHGTHCAGIIGAVGNNGVGVAGMNWQVRIMPLKSLDNQGSGYVDDAVRAVLYANNHGAQVISMSWGAPQYSQALKDAIDASSAIVVCAAGNNGQNIDVAPFYPASFTSPNIITVAATDRNDNLASFSNYGMSSVDVAAPGVAILSTFPGNRYAWSSGTSMATPFVSGLAALIKSVRPDLSNTEVKQVIMNTVDRKASLSGSVATGGRINAQKALQSITATTKASAAPAATPPATTGTPKLVTANLFNYTGIKIPGLSSSNPFGTGSYAIPKLSGSNPFGSGSLAIPNLSSLYRSGTGPIGVPAALAGMNQAAGGIPVGTTEGSLDTSGIGIAPGGTIASSGALRILAEKASAASHDDRALVTVSSGTGITSPGRETARVTAAGVGTGRNAGSSGASNGGSPAYPGTTAPYLTTISPAAAIRNLSAAYA